MCALLTTTECFGYVLSHRITIICLLFSRTCDAIEARVASALVVLFRVVPWIFKYQMFLKRAEENVLILKTISIVSFVF